MLNTTKRRIGLANLRRGGSSTRRWARGGTLIETAFVMGMLVSVTLMCFQYGFYFYIKNLMADAAREGVRAAVVTTSGSNVTSTMQTAVDRVMHTAAGIPTTSYTRTVSPTTPSSGQAVTVTVTATWGTIGVSVPSLLGGISTARTLNCYAVMVHE